MGVMAGGPLHLQRRLGLLSVAVVLLAWLSTPRLAGIVVRHDRDDARYLELGEGHPAVCDIGFHGGHGTLVAPRWVLTAGHVVKNLSEGSTVACGGRRYPVAETRFHPGFVSSRTELRNDVALVALSEPVPDVEPAALYAQRNEVGRTVVFVGHGRTGTGRTGASRRGGERRGATNRVERVEEEWLVFRFDPPASATDLEGVSGPGDSGGPALIEVDRRVFVAGVSSWQDNRAQGGRQGVYGVLEYYARVSSYLDWITATIAEGDLAGGNEEGRGR